MKYRIPFSKRRIALLAFDVVCFLLISLLLYGGVSLFLSIELASVSEYAISSLLLLVSIYLFRVILGTDSNIWRYGSTTSYLSIVLSSALGTCLAVVLTGIFASWHGWWHTVTLASLFTLLNLSSRFVYSMLHKRQNISAVKKKIDVAIVGAGQLGALLANELRISKNSYYNPICFIDKDKSKHGMKVAGLRVYDESDDVIELIKNKLPVQEIFVALPGIDSEETKRVFDFYSRTGCKVKLYDMPFKEAGVSGVGERRQLREFQIEDLLFRKPIKVTGTAAADYYRGKTVLVTGGGGSIGSEISRQVAECQPKKLIIVDIYENNAYEIQQELVRKYGDGLSLAVEIASVRDIDRLDCIFEKYRPEIVFHAAAHKHVPLMEHSCCEAIKNNVLGTYNTANVAEKYGVEKFILISTDKAVNPTNIMGASKRMCEMIVQCRIDSKTSFAAVRFGNVLGSNGSVIPLFKKQIQNGGPVTITDKRIIRYFMTIAEASQLVMQAGAIAKRGELFVLDMGKPVKIYDLAENMIRLSGFTPNVDIMIEEIGLRPGEKLYEELLIKSEELSKTDNEMIFIEKDAPLSREEVEEKLRILKKAVSDTLGELEAPAVKAAFKETVPTYHDPEKVNSKTAGIVG